MSSWGFVPCNMHHRILLEWLENGDPLYRKTLLCETLVTESSNTSTRELKWQIRKNAKGNRKSCCAYRVTDTLVFGGNKGDFYLSRELLRAIVSQKAGSLRHLLSLVLVPWTVREAFLRSFFLSSSVAANARHPLSFVLFPFLSFFCFLLFCFCEPWRPIKLFFVFFFFFHCNVPCSELCCSRLN